MSVPLRTSKNAIANPLYWCFGTGLSKMYEEDFDAGPEINKSDRDVTYLGF
jgi:hypothetical protein